MPLSGWASLEFGSCAELTQFPTFCRTTSEGTSQAPLCSSIAVVWSLTLPSLPDACLLFRHLQSAAGCRTERWLSTPPRHASPNGSLPSNDAHLPPPTPTPPHPP